MMLKIMTNESVYTMVLAVANVHSANVNMNER